MMFQNLAKNTCTGMKFKAICYEWQYACELKEILWHWEIRMHVFLKEQPVLKMKWCSVASSTTWQRNVCQRNDVEATIMLYMYLHIALLSPVIVYFPGPSTGLWHITTCPCIYLLHPDEIYDYKSFLPVLKTTIILPSTQCLCMYIYTV